MNKFNSPLDIYKILPKTNCRKCDLSTCMAFAMAVFKEQKRLADCPHLDEKVIAQFGGTASKRPGMEKFQEKALEELRNKIRGADLSSRAELLGGRSNGKGLIIKCLGKDFEIDREGNIISECHTHAWFAIPFLNYILFAKGKDVRGEWVPFRELKSGATWNPLFEQRCEKPIKEIADRHPELFEYLVGMFSGASSPAGKINSDISVVLFPFPKVPVLVCYWRPEDDLESQLHIFFDGTADENLGIEALFSLGAGLAGMLEKIMLKHC